jgi:hypothetical protein
MKGLINLLSSNYDPNTKRVNCPNSKGVTYQHELRHKMIDEGHPIMMELYTTIYILGCIATVLLWNPAHMIPAFIMTLILEVDAYVYGWRHRHD